MSDTPKTDKEIERISSQFDGEADNIEYAMDQMGALARALERELASAKAENATLKAERDEARRLYCHAQAATILDARPEAMAARLGWHCFKEAK